MVRDIRVKESIFRVGSLTADAAGLFDVYSPEVVNGTIQSVTIGSNTFTNTGSLILMESGTVPAVGNTIIQTRAGSMMQTVYPIVYGNANTGGGIGSPQAFVRPVINGQLRLVGSGLGNGTSGLIYMVRYV